MRTANRHRVVTAKRKDMIRSDMIRYDRGSLTWSLRSLHWLKINERIEYKLLSLTYKVLTTCQLDYAHNLIFVQSRQHA